MQLRLEQATVTYGNKTALKNFSFTFSSGIYGLIGENGAGKTTLMNVIAGVIRPGTGKIKTDGSLIDANLTEYLKHVGYLPQENPLYPDFTVEEYMKYVSYLKRQKSNREEIERLLTLVSLTDQKRVKCKKLSGGMKRRLGIAQALIGNPKLLILDEPTAGVDVMERIKFRNIISGLGKDGIVIFSTHTISDIGKIAGNAIFLKEGNMVLSGAVSDLLSELDGRVWEAEGTQQDYEKIFGQCGEKKITNINIQDLAYKVRYVSSDPIVEGAKNVAPAIEDVYADIMG